MQERGIFPNNNLIKMGLITEKLINVNQDMNARSSTHVLDFNIILSKKKESYFLS